MQPRQHGGPGSRPQRAAGLDPDQDQAATTLTTQAVHRPRRGLVPALDSPLALTEDELTVGSVMTVRARQVVAGVVGATLVLVVLSFALDLQVLRGVTVTLFLLVGLGAAPVLLLKPMSGMWFALYTVTTSLVTTVALGFGMAVLHAWHPYALLGAVAVATVVLLALAVNRDLKRVGA